MHKSIEPYVQKVVSWYFSREALPYWAVLLCDCVIVFFSLLMAHIFTQGVMATLQNIGPIVLSLGIYLICYIVSFRLFSTYSGVIRYSSFTDLMRVAEAMVVGSVLVEVIRQIAHSGSFLCIINAYDLMVGSMLASVLMWMMRVVVKVLFDHRIMGPRPLATLVFGTKMGGVGIAKSVRNQTDSPYRIVGFLTNIPEMVSHRLMDLPILDISDPAMWEYITRKRIRVVMISPLVQDYFVNECQDMINKFLAKGIKILMIPAEQEWDGKKDISHSMLHEVSVEDLLPRKKIEVDLVSIGEMLKGKRILITGAAGSIGSEVVRQVAKFEPEELVLIDQAETPMHDIRLMMKRNFSKVKALTVVTSITNATHMEQLFKDHRPQYVFHAAAYKHVPMMEDNPALAIQNNVYGTRVIADMAVKYGTKKFVMISTDKAVNPTNVMGCSKRICEIYCQSLNQAISNKEGLKQVDGSPAVTQFVTTRFGNVLGSNGSVIPIFKQQILNGGPVTVTHPDIIRFFMLIPEACRLVLEAGTMGNGGEIFVFDMGEPVRIADLAKRMIELMGAKDVEIVYSGLRDGEKLYEEVLNDVEQTKPTRHPKIKVAAVREYAYAEALKQEKDLYDLSFTYDDMAIVRKMKEIVPEYKSRQSKYEVLD